MRILSQRCAYGTVAAVLLAATATPALAQSGAALIVAPWPEHKRIDAEADFLIQGGSSTRDAEDASFKLQWYEGRARARFSERRGAPAVGADFQYINLRHDHPDLPDELTDQSVGFGMGIAEWDAWEVAFTAGGGYAGNNPYGSGPAFYALGNLIFSRTLDPDTTLQLLVNWDGNRSIFPDIPLPGFAYHKRVSERMSYTVGLPHSAIAWQPLEPLTLDARYTFPLTVDATATWTLTSAINVFGSFQNRFRGYHIDGTNRNRRLFFQQRRIEGGLQIVPCDRIDLTLAGGLAFDQRFETGWDVRRLDDTLKVGDAPYLRAAVGLRF